MIDSDIRVDADGHGDTRFPGFFITEQDCAFPIRLEIDEFEGREQRIENLVLVLQYKPSARKRENVDIVCLQRLLDTILRPMLGLPVNTITRECHQAGRLRVG
jgi:hypothetical protein